MQACPLTFSHLTITVVTVATHLSASTTGLPCWKRVLAGELPVHALERDDQLIQADTQLIQRLDVLLR